MRLLLLLLTSVILCSSDTYSQCNHPDYTGLMELYNSTGGPNWTNNTGWKEGAAGTNCDPCNGWHGIFCDINNRVISIHLYSNNLIGHLPNLNLEKLEGLFLPMNSLNSIPNFSNLPDLQVINFDRNQITALPNFTNIPKLFQLSCDRNLLTGEIPDFTNLPKLKFLLLRKNKLTGNIPDFTNLPNLETFSCYENLITGNIPDFTNLPNLKILDCSFNNLSGPIPNFTNIPNLEGLLVDNNQLSGNLPNFTNLPNLIAFYCENNLLTGQIPDFSNLSKLQKLDCDSNSITGIIPNFSNLQNLNSFSCGTNKLSGSIPNFSNLPQLMRFYCDNNQLTGEIPSYFSSKPFEVLWFSDNYLFGELPYFKIELLQRVYLNNNNFSGCIPPYYCDIPIVSASNNPQLPFTGNISEFCSNNRISEGAYCNDGLSVTNVDYINNCDCVGLSLDTCFVTIYDTIISQVFDTTFITETISVTDTLIINLNIPNAPNDPVTNRIIVYPNPASSHVYIDFGDHTLMQNYSCQILNALGQPIFFTPIDQKLYYLDLNTWGGKGTYFIKIINDFGQTVETKKIVLQ